MGKDVTCCAHLPPHTHRHTNIHRRKIDILKRGSGSGSLGTLLPADVDVGPRCGAETGSCWTGFPGIVDLVLLDGSNAVTGRLSEED